MRTIWEQMTRSEFVLENYEQFLTARPSILVTDCKSLYDAIHKEGSFTMQYTRKGQLQRLQTRDWQLSWPQSRPRQCPAKLI